jgi:hypothetical protein
MVTVISSSLGLNHNNLYKKGNFFNKDPAVCDAPFLKCRNLFFLLQVVMIKRSLLFTVVAQLTDTDSYTL